MTIDFHTHGKLAKKLPFSTDYTKHLFQQAKASGLDALCLTEHFNTIGFDQIYAYIAQNYEQIQDCFMVEGVKVFPGMEVDIAEGGHILVLGQLESILAMNKALEPYKQKDNFLSFSALIELSSKYKVILGAAHVFREGGHIAEQPIELLKQLSFVDLNGKDYATKREAAKQEVTEFSEKLNLPIVGGSDTHQYFQYGCIWNVFEKECITINELEQAINNGEYEIEISASIEFKVETATILKRALKTIYDLNGDYIAVLTEK